MRPTMPKPTNTSDFIYPRFSGTGRVEKRRGLWMLVLPHGDELAEKLLRRTKFAWLPTGLTFSPRRWTWLRPYVAMIVFGPANPTGEVEGIHVVAKPGFETAAINFARKVLGLGPVEIV